MTTASKHIEVLRHLEHDLSRAPSNTIDCQLADKVSSARNYLEQLQAAAEKAHEELFVAQLHSSPIEIMKRIDTVREHLGPFVKTE